MTNTGKNSLMQSVRPVADPILAKIKRDVEAKLPPTLKDGYDRIIVAGLKIMFSPETHAMALRALQEAIQRRDISSGVALSTVTLIGMVYKASQGKMSIAAAFPAAIVLMCYVFEFLEGAQKITITPPLVAKTTSAVTQGVLKLFGITQQQFAQGIEESRKQASAPVSPSSPVPPSVPAGGA